MSRKTIILIVFALVVICFAYWIGEMRGQAKSRARVNQLQTKLTKTEVELANISDANEANCRYLDLVEKERDRLRQTMAHRLYPRLSVACPVFIATRPEPDGPLTREQVLLLGRHLALTIREGHYAISEQFVLAGVPNAGQLLAEGFLQEWGSPNTVKDVVPLRLMRDPNDLGFALYGQKQLMVRCRYGVIVDNASSTGVTDRLAAREILSLLTKGRGKQRVRVDCLFLVDREEGAREVLDAIGVKLIAQVKLRTIVRRAIAIDRVQENIWQRLKRFQDTLREAQGSFGIPTPRPS